jgi:bacteriocin biosynthesis cyclodehydratase domain-containing protein
MDDPGAAATLRLAPGLRVVRRGLDQVQVGLHPGRRAVLARTPAVERTLATLLGDGDLDDSVETAGVLDALRRHDCLADHATATPARSVRLVGDLPGAHDLLAACGVAAVGGHGDVTLVLGAGETDRDLLDPLVRHGDPHLVVRLVDGCALVGPFVAPGVTACLRCVDAHRAVTDPDHVTVTQRYVHASSIPRRDGVPDVADPALAAVALSTAVRDVVAHLDGRRPATWSRTILLGPDPGQRAEEAWSRHPECGCCWSPLGGVSGTMEE